MQACTLTVVRLNEFVKGQEPGRDDMIRAWMPWQEAATWAMMDSAPNPLPCVPMCMWWDD